MSSGGGSNTIEQSDPWAGQQPFLTTGFQRALTNLNDGGPQYFPNRTYIPFSSQTQEGLGMIEDRARSGSAVNDNLQSFTNQALTMDANTAPVSNYVNQTLSQGAPALSDGAAYAGVGRAGPTLNATGQNALTATASGSMLGSNPYLDSMYDNAASRVTRNFREAVNPALDTSFSLAGRTGSAAHQAAAATAQQELGDSLSGLASNIYGSAYESERGRQLNAASTLNQQDLQSFSLGSQDDLSRRSLGSSVFGQQAGIQQGAASLGNQYSNNIMSNQNRTALIAPQAANAAYDDAARLIGVGETVEGQAANVLNDQIARYDAGQNAPDIALANYMAAIRGDYGGTRTVNSERSSASRTQAAAGGALAGGALGAQYGSSLGPWGAAIGAVGGGLLGYFA